MGNPEEEQLYNDLWKLIKKLATEPESSSHARALSLISQNCQALDYPQSADLFIRLAKSEYPKQQEEQDPLFLISINRLTVMHRCCDEHQDSERQIALEGLIEQLKENASKAGDLEDELRLLDTLKFLKSSREAREGRGVESLPLDVTVETKSKVTDLSVPRVQLGADDLFDLKQELQSCKFEMERIRDDFKHSNDVLTEKVDHLDQRTTTRCTQLDTRIDEKLSNRSLAIGIGIAVFIAVVGILIAILLVA